MHKLKLNIAGISIDVQHTESVKLRNMDTFVSTDTTLTDFFVTIDSANYIKKPEGKTVIDEMISWTMSEEDSHILYGTFRDKNSDEILALLQMNTLLGQASIIVCENDFYSNDAIASLAFEVLFRTIILTHSRILLHASAISWNEKGLLFSAPSGTGKSTQASLWQEHMGAKTLNDDRPCIRIDQDMMKIYGTPWTGSPISVLNDSTPLHAIVVLEQSLSNTIKKLTSQEAVQKLMPRFFLPYYDANRMKVALDLIEKILERIPVYLLECRPDQEAVELVYECIK